MFIVNHYAIPPSILKTSSSFIIHCWVKVILLLFIFFHWYRPCPFHHACLLNLLRLRKLVLVRCGKLNTLVGLWAACMLAYRHLNEVECNYDDCRHSVAEGTVDVPMRLLEQISSFRTARTLWHNLQPSSDHYLILASHLSILYSARQTTSENAWPRIN